MEPIELLIIIKVLIPIYCLILSLINLNDEIKRTQKLQITCSVMGWKFSKRGKTEQINNLLHFYLFSLGSFKKIRNLLYSQTEELNTAIFDYQTQIAGNKLIETVIYFRSPQLNLPNFNLLRKPYLEENTFGDQDIVLSSNSEFAEKYALLSDDEAAVRQLFSNSLINYLAQKRTLNVEGSGDRLILYCSDGIVKPERLEAFLEEGTYILELFQESNKQNSLIA